MTFIHPALLTKKHIMNDSLAIRSFNNNKYISVVSRHRTINSCFFLGLFAGMSSIGIYIGGKGITLFTLVLVYVVISRILKGHFSIKNARSNRLLCLMFGLSLLTCVINFYVVPITWLEQILINAASLLLGEFTFCFLFNKKEFSSAKESMIQGLRINFLIQAAWGILQFIIGNYFNVSLNSLVGLYTPKVLAVTEVTGLCWERAEFIFIMLLGFSLFKNIYLKSLAIIVIFLTKSRTGMIVAAVIISLNIFYYICHPRKMRKQLSKLSNFVWLLLITLFLCVFSGAIFSYVNDIWFSIIHYDYDASGATHLFYYRVLPNIIGDSRTSLFSVLFGYGNGGSGYPYALIYGKSMDIPWSVESTVLNIFWSFGLIGFLLFFVWLLDKVFKSWSRNERHISFLLITVFIGGFFYTLLPNFGLIALIVLSSGIGKEVHSYVKKAQFSN